MFTNNYVRFTNMKKVTNQVKVLFIVLLFVGSFFSSFMVITTNGFTSNQKISNDIENNGVTIIALSNKDETTITSCEKLVTSLDPYFETDLIFTESVDDMKESITNSLDKNIILMGHSNIEEIQVNNQLLDWDSLAKITNNHQDKNFIIPTCYSKNIYNQNPEIVKNVLGMFPDIIDYRVSISFTMVSLGVLTKNLELTDIGLQELFTNFNYLIKPEESLPITETGTFSESGKGLMPNNDLVHYEAMASTFMLEASIGFAIKSYLFNKLGLTVNPIGFLGNICCFAANWITFSNFVINLGRTYFEKVYDLGTTGSYLLTHDYLPFGEYIWYYRFNSVSTYRLVESPYTNDRGYIKQETHIVTMTIDIMTLNRLILFNIPIISLFDMNIILWRLIDTTTEILYYPPIPPPEDPRPPVGGGIDVPL